MANFPTSLDNGTSLPNPTSTSTQNSPDHAGLHSSENAAIIAVEGKVGIGATTPVANTLLFGTGAGTSAWQGLTSAQLLAVLSDETGTGSAVFANTPTLITPKADTINESTPGNGVTVSSVNLKSGVVTGVTTLTSSGAITAGNGLTLSAGTFTAPNGSVSTKVLTNPHKFHVYRSAAQTVTSATYTLVQFDTKVYDTGTNIDVVTNKGRFTAPITGFYNFSATVDGISTGAGFNIIALYKNGSAFIQGNKLRSDVATGTSSSINATLSLSATDYVEVYVFLSGTNLELNAAPYTTWFQGFLVSQT